MDLSVKNVKRQKPDIKHKENGVPSLFIVLQWGKMTDLQNPG